MSNNMSRYLFHAVVVLVTGGPAAVSMKLSCSISPLQCPAGTYCKQGSGDTVSCEKCHVFCDHKYTCAGPTPNDCLYCDGGLTKQLNVPCKGPPPCWVKPRPCPPGTYCNERADYTTTCPACHETCHPQHSCDGPLAEQCHVCQDGLPKPAGFVPCPVATVKHTCHQNCHPDHPCDGPTAEQCRVCRNGAPKPAGSTPCQPDFLQQPEQCDRGQFKPAGLGQACIACPYKMFGPECRYTCHCKNDEECSKVNGDCPSRDCHPDWEGPGCTRLLPKLINPPSVVSRSCMNITITWSAFEQNLDEGEGPFGQYNVWFRQSDEPTWNNPLNVTDSQDGRRDFTASITTGLAPDKEYVFRVDVVGMEYGKLFQKARPGNPTNEVLNECNIRNVKKRIIRRMACPKKKIFRVVCPL